MKLHIIFFLCALSILTQGQTSPEPFISFPTASEFCASPDGTSIAWVLNDRGLRNVFLKSGNNTVKQITAYADDDGQELTELTFTADGKHILFVRGGAPNTRGESPNPASLTVAPDKALWMVSVSGGDPVKILKGSGFVLSKDSKTGVESVIFSRGGQIHKAELKPDASAVQIFFARGGNYSPVISPDGSEILFVSDRGDHSFIGIFNIGLNKVRWIQPDTNRDMMPVWSPDGKQVAFIRLPGQRAGELSNLTVGQKFSIIVSSASGDQSKAAFNSPGKDGIHNFTYPSPAFSWHSSGRLIFFSEHTGTLHIWSVNPDGSDLKDLTPGSGEVESYTASSDGRTLWFDSNTGDIDRRHIWKTDVRKGLPEQVTKGEGIEMYPATDGKNLYAYSSAFNQAKTLVQFDPASGKIVSAISASGNSVFNSAFFLKPEQIIFTAPDGKKIHGQLFIDRSLKGKRPGILFMHGGPTRQMLLGFHYSDYYSQSYAFNQYLAKNGYAVLSVNFRNGIGYGRDFRMSPDQGPRGAVEYQDIVAGGKYLQSLQEVDAGKIGLWGGSYGGYLTAMGLARNPEIFKAGVDLHGVHDWAFRAREFWVPGGWWGLTEKEYNLAVSSSPVADLSGWKAPVLLVSGDDDRNVMFHETTDLAERLREKNITVETLVLPDEVHGFLRYESWKAVFTRASSFFEQFLKK